MQNKYKDSIDWLFEQFPSYYNLTDQIPAEMHHAIGSKKSKKTLDYPPIQLHYWSEKMINQHQIIFDEVKVFIL
jgi:hypothetical protein